MPDRSPSRRLRLAPLGFLLLLPALVVACGGSGGPKQVPADAVALVDGQPITRAAFASLLATTRQGYRLRDQSFPAVGTAAFRKARNGLLDQLVLEAELEQHAHSEFDARCPRAGSPPGLRPSGKSHAARGSSQDPGRGRTLVCLWA